MKTEQCSSTLRTKFLIENKIGEEFFGHLSVAFVRKWVRFPATVRVGAELRRAVPGDTHREGAEKWNIWRLIRQQRWRRRRRRRRRRRSAKVVVAPHFCEIFFSWAMDKFSKTRAGGGFGKSRSSKSVFPPKKWISGFIESTPFPRNQTLRQ